MNKNLTPFQKEMEIHLIEFKEKEQYFISPKVKDKIFYPEISDGIYPPVKHAFLQYSYDNSMPYHDYANHVRSSQLFCINLMFPLIKNEIQVLLSFFGKLISKELIALEHYEFEYSPEKNWLGEWRGTERPYEYITSVDCALFFRGADNRKYVFLVEFKFTENEFTNCNGYESNGNKSRDVCDDVKLLFADYNKCYLQTTHPRKSPRTYFNYFFDLKTDFANYAGTGCPFIKNHQCLRNHSLSKALVKQNIAGEAYFCLLYHDGNEDIKKEWNEYYEMLSPVLKKELKLIKASDIISLSKDVIYKKYFSDRYKI